MAAAAAAERTLFVIGFGAVGQAWYKFISHVNSKGLLKGVKKIAYFAPEIKEKKVDGIFEFNPAPFVTRESLSPLLDSVRAARKSARRAPRARAPSRAPPPSLPSSAPSPATSSSSSPRASTRTPSGRSARRAASTL